MIFRAKASGSGNANRQFAMNTAASWAVNILKMFIQLLMLPIMARLLGPAEYGLYALALPTVLFFMTLADGGLGASLSREPESSTVVWSTAFWVLLGSCTAMAVCVSASGVVLAAASGQPRLIGLMALLSTSLVFLGLSVVSDARLIRRGNLVFHSGADLVSSVAGAVVAVSMASAGMGAWSLAGQYVTASAMRALVLNLAAFEMPLFCFDLALLRSHVSTGGVIIGSRLSEFFGRFLENIIIGRAFGATALGTLSLANQVSRFLCDAAANPVWGALYSHSLRGDPTALAVFHARLSRLLGIVLFPVAILLAASAPQVFGFVLGPKWGAAAPMVQGIIPFYAVASVSGLCGAILLANGRSGLILLIYAGIALLRVLVVFGTAFTTPLVVAWGSGLVFMVQAAGMFVVLSHRTRLGVELGVILRDVAIPFAAALFGAAIYLAVLRITSDSPLGTMMALAIGGLSYGCILVAVEGPRLLSDAKQIQRAVFARRGG